MITSSAVPPALQMLLHLPLYTLNARPRTDLLTHLCPASNHTAHYSLRPVGSGVFPVCPFP